MKAEYQVVKVSWRGEYKRLWVIDTKSIRTLDLYTRRITNEWTLDQIRQLERLSNDTDFMMNNMLFRTSSRVALFSSYYQAKALTQSISYPVINCTKRSRKGWDSRRALQFRYEAIIQTDTKGMFLTSYPYQQIEAIYTCPDDTNSIVLQTTGERLHLFSAADRREILHQIALANTRLGLRNKDVGVMTKTDFIARRRYLVEDTTPFVFQVEKYSSRAVVTRRLQLSTTCITEQDHYELDQMRTIVSVVPYDQIRAIAISGTDELEILIQPDTIRLYRCRQRDDFLQCLLDLTHDTLPLVRRLVSPALYLLNPEENHEFLLRQVLLEDKNDTLAAFNMYVPLGGFDWEINRSLVESVFAHLIAQLKGQVDPDEIVDLLFALSRFCSIPYLQFMPLVNLLESLSSQKERIVVYWVQNLLDRLLTRPKQQQQIDFGNRRSNQPPIKTKTIQMDLGYVYDVLELMPQSHVLSILS